MSPETNIIQKALVTYIFIFFLRLLDKSLVEGLGKNHVVPLDHVAAAHFYLDGLPISFQMFLFISRKVIIFFCISRSSWIVKILYICLSYFPPTSFQCHVTSNIFVCQCVLRHGLYPFAVSIYFLEKTCYLP